MLQRDAEMLLPSPAARLPARPPGGDRVEGEIDAIAVLRMLRRNFWLIALVAGAGTLLAVVVVLLMTPQYSATAVLRVDPGQPSMVVSANAAPTPRSTQAENALVESDVALLESPAHMRRVAQRLDLGADPEFANAASALTRVKRFVRSLFAPADEGEPRDPNAAAARALAGKIYSRRVGLTYLIELTAWSVDAEKAARLANTTVELFVESQLEARREMVGRVNRLLNEHIMELRDRLQRSEEAIQRYRAEMGLFDPGGEILSDQQMTSLSEELVAARGQTAAAKAKYDQLDRIELDELQSAVAVPEIQSSEVIANLRTRYAEVSQRLAEQSARYGPNHPSIVQARAELQNVSEQIGAEISRMVASARTEYEMALAREKSLEASLEEVKSVSSRQGPQLVRLNELVREAEANRELYQAVLQGAKQTAAARDLQLPGAQIVSEATTPSGPSSPRRTLIVALGFVASVGAGIAVSVAREITSTGMRRAEDLHENFGIYPLASVPLVDSRAGNGAFDPRRRLWLRPVQRTIAGAIDAGRGASDITGAVLDNPESAFAESIRSLRFGLKRYSEYGQDMRVVLVTSALPGEGKSTVAANLAREAAAAGDRVLLIDADLRRPRLAGALRLPANDGLAGLLSGPGNLSNLVWREPRTGAHVIAGSEGIPGPRALRLLSSEQMSNLLTVVRDNFDLVVIDTAPLLPITDARVLVDRVDGVVMVVASESTSREAVAAALHQVPGLDARLVGMVLNRMPEDGEGYSYRHYEKAAPNTG